METTEGNYWKFCEHLRVLKMSIIHRQFYSGASETWYHLVRTIFDANITIWAISASPGSTSTDTIWHCSIVKLCYNTLLPWRCMLFIMLLAIKRTDSYSLLHLSFRFDTMEGLPIKIMILDIWTKRAPVMQFDHRSCLHGERCANPDLEFTFN